MYDLVFLVKVRVLCDEYNVLFIVDEIVINFGWMGKFFVCEYVGIFLDIMCLGKVLIGGMMMMVVILCIRKIVEIILKGEVGVFMYGFIFMVNFLVVSVVIVSIDLLEVMKWEKRVKIIEIILEE